MLKIYSTTESLYCAKLRILLQHKQAQWLEISPEGGCGSAAYRALIPSGTMPAMIDGDFVIADSEAIAEYLNETIAEPAMLPSTAQARAKCRERSRFHDTRMEPEVRALFPHIASGMQGSDFSIVQSQKINQRLHEFSRLLLTDTTLDLNLLSLGECGFPVSFAWLDAFTPIMGFELKWPEVVLDYRQKVEAHDAVHTVLGNYAQHITQWVESKITG
ncbi:MAG: glutathione S-transferase [Gammaproteobacteria bacterium]|jgi:glutathione S-transferase/maleylpyruvate isomerase